MLRSRRALLTLVASISFATLMHSAQAADEPKVSFKTSMGEIVVELYPEKAPKTVENFLQYVKKGHYSGTIFHRVIDGFMIQGGGFDKDMKQKPALATVINEGKNGLKNDIYTLAMARTSEPHSASAQFFINVADNKMLDAPGRDGWGYAVFGKVIKGTEVVDKIRAVKTTSSGMYQDVPATAVIIESATILK